MLNTNLNRDAEGQRLERSGSPEEHAEEVIEHGDLTYFNIIKKIKKKVFETRMVAKVSFICYGYSFRYLKKRICSTFFTLSVQA